MRSTCLVILLIGPISCGKSPPPALNLTSEEQQKITTPAEQIENPEYTRWNKFPVGTTVTRRMVTDSAKFEGKTVTTFVITLTSKTTDYVIVDNQATTEYADGRVVKNPPITSRIPRLVVLPDGIDKTKWGKLIGQTEEPITVLDKTYKCVKSQSTSTTDAGKLLQTVWSSEEMPGTLVRSHSVVPDVEETTTIEIIDLVIPKE